MDAVAEGQGVGVEVHEDPRPEARSELVPYEAQACGVGGTRRRRALDRDRDGVSGGVLDHEVDLDSTLVEVVVRARPRTVLRVGGGPRDLRHHERLTRRGADAGIVAESSLVEFEQRTEHARVGDVKLWALDDAVSQLDMSGRQAQHEEELLEDVQVAGRGLGVDRQLRGEACRCGRPEGAQPAQRFEVTDFSAAHSAMECSLCHGSVRSARKGHVNDPRPGRCLNEIF